MLFQSPWIKHIVKCILPPIKKEHNGTQRQWSWLMFYTITSLTLDNYIGGKVIYNTAVSVLWRLYVSKQT